MKLENEISPQRSKKRQHIFITIAASAALIFSALVYFQKQQQVSEETLVVASSPQPKYHMYGFDLDTFQVFHGTISPNMFLSNLLLDFGVSYPTIDQLVRNTKSIFDVRNIRSGKPYAVVSNDSCGKAQYFIYEPNDYSYYLFDLKDSLNVVEIERPVDTILNTFSAYIESSPWNALKGSNHQHELIAKMEDALAWTIDFHHIQQGDMFKLYYETHVIEGEEVGTGLLKGVYYKTRNNEYYSIFYENDHYTGYYDEEARPMKKAFLKAPVKYSRISSKYNLRRKHPIYKRTMPHLGTDYAAPYGTPIYAVADGYISRKGRTKGNGNFVKIKHDKTYSTQYLHMQSFAKGLDKGDHVKQGQVIGYVGSTGAATGPHVCYRFWKNGKQVNPLVQNLPPPEPLPEAEIESYMEVRDIIKNELDQISIPIIQEKEEHETEEVLLESD